MVFVIKHGNLKELELSEFKRIYKRTKRKI